jgi:predicted DNA-binding protein
MSNSYPIRLSDDLNTQLRNLSVRTDISKSDLIRLAIKAGIPSVEEKLMAVCEPVKGGRKVRRLGR